MKGIDAGDLPGWIGAVAGVAALGWQAWTQMRASSSRRTGSIKASPARAQDDVLVKVEWLLAEQHTTYEVSARLLSPRGATIAEAEEYYEPPKGDFIFSPAMSWRPGRTSGQRIHVRMDQQDFPFPTARFTVVGLDQPITPFRIKVAVKDTASGRVVAKRALSIAWSMI